MTEFMRTEVGAYYAHRVPGLRQADAKRWRGSCPIHGGKGASFTVSATTGRWFCFSQCGRGGDLIALEMELSGGAFVAARRSVFATVGRPEANRDETPWERHIAAASARHERRNRELSALWRRQMLRLHDAELERLKKELEQVPEADFDQHGEAVYRVSLLAERMRSYHGADLAIAFRKQLEQDRAGTLAILRAAIADEEHAGNVTARMVRLLERATAMGRAA